MSNPVWRLMLELFRCYINLVPTWTRSGVLVIWSQLRLDLVLVLLWSWTRSGVLEIRTRSGVPLLLSVVVAAGGCWRCPRRWTRRWSSTWASCWTSSGPCTPRWTRFETPLRRGSRPSRGMLEVGKLRMGRHKSTFGATCLYKHLLARLICICLIDQQKEILDYLLKLLPQNVSVVKI